ncbi:MAG: aminotransferase class V-fold PLP-dependent enzyme [Planctomycetota bacterium]|nr:aminotransferase class V-fold PLP-dependent enzyme [Planctomycetota bacterium]
MFDKSDARFPIKSREVFVNHCGIGPTCRAAVDAEIKIAQQHVTEGTTVANGYDAVLADLRSAAAELIGTVETNMSFMRNTSEGMNLIANGFPWQAGDQIITYRYEYPSNMFPWVLQCQNHGVDLVLLDNTTWDGQPTDSTTPIGWSLDDLERKLTPKTRMVTLSHVQFSSGFAADLRALSDLCEDRGVLLVIDAAQSLGCMPVNVDDYKIAAIAWSGWKWMLGPIGTGLLYTSPEFRERLQLTMAGFNSMAHSLLGSDYLDYTWEPITDGRVFEYSTEPLTLAAGLAASIRDNFLQYGPVAVFEEVTRLQTILREGLAAQDTYMTAGPADAHRSGILSVTTRPDVADADGSMKLLIAEFRRRNIRATVRCGYLRLGPHYYNTDDEMRTVVEAIHNAAGR